MLAAQFVEITEAPFIDNLLWREPTIREKFDDAAYKGSRGFPLKADKTENSRRDKTMPDQKILSFSAPEFSENALKVLRKRYLNKDDTGVRVIEEPADMLWRVAETVAEAEAAFGVSAAERGKAAGEFYSMMAALEFLPNSPTLMNAGKPNGQLSACFVLPIEDSISEIFKTVRETAIVHQTGGGTGFSFSRLRPNGDIISTTKGTSSGPLSFLRIFDSVANEIKQGGTRRGANMGVLRVDHPDILDFISCKRETNVLTNFNLSVAITDSFMEALAADGEYELVNPKNKEVSGRLKARDVYSQIVEQAWLTGEPGLLFIDRINATNPTPDQGEIEATNPCGEAALLPYEACNLGSINLAKMFDGVGGIDWDRLKKTVRTAIRFLDDVIEANHYPFPEIDRVSKRNRKVGLGIMGFADLLLQMEIAYASAKGVALAKKVMKFVDDEALAASVELGRLRGPYPGSKLKKGKAPRNAIRTTIAPTGTLSILAGCSSGIEPMFALAYTKTVMDGTALVEVNPYFESIARAAEFYSDALMEKIVKNAGSVHGFEEVPEFYQKLFATAHDIAPHWHVDVQAAFQAHTNNAVSKTINFAKEATPQEIDESFQRAYKSGCKGLTIYRDGSRQGQVLSVAAPAKEEMKAGGQAPYIAPVKRERPPKLQGTTYAVETGCGHMYITVNRDAESRGFELFSSLGKSGGCAGAQLESIGRLVSLAWRYGVPEEPIVKQLKGISCHKPHGFGLNRVVSCADAVAQAIRLHQKDHGNGMEHEKEDAPMPGGACTLCGGPIQKIGKCEICHNCAASTCS